LRRVETKTFGRAEARPSSTLARNRCTALSALKSSLTNRPGTRGLVDTRVPAVCFGAARASRGSSWRPCQRRARHIPPRFAGELLSSYARGREAFLAASLLRKFASDERDRCLAGQSVVHEGDEGLVYRPLSILSYLGPSKSNFQSTTLRSGMSALMSSRIASPVSIPGSTMKMSALGPRPSVSITLRTLLCCFQSGDLSHSSFCAPVMQRKYCSPKSDRDKAIRSYQPYRMMSGAAIDRAPMSDLERAKWVS
jgi:hypothetical protein